MACLPSLWRATFLCAGLALAFVGIAEQGVAQEQDRQQLQAARRQSTVPLVAAASALQIDGKLEEDAWGQAARLDGFLEVVPVQGRPADPKTEVWLMRDQKALYLAFVCYEPQPEGMVLQNMRRDAFLNDDDRMEFVFDTFRDGQTAYFFQLSAAGSRGDALIGDNGRRFNKPWNAFWEASTQILSDRWTAEVRIPFATLAFGDDPTWSANFERYRGSDRSNYRWSGARRELRVNNVSEAGQLSGFDGLDQGQGIEFRPYFKGRYQDEVGDTDLLGDFGGEVSWNFTPQMKASVTWNTDFAETEVDDRRVNLTRFPLFFPEKRDFFLQDSTLFQFGEIGGRGGSGTNLLPFFSRRIGLAGGREVPLDAGLRVAGRAGKWDLGFLGVHTGEESTLGVPDGDLFVLRPSYRINRSLSVGSLITSGNPLAATDNTVLGGDVRWTTTRLLPGLFSWNNFLVWSDDAGIDAQGLGFGSQASLTTSNWRYEASILGTQDDFLPALGFIRRPGEVLSSGSVSYTPRPTSGPVRLYRFRLAPSAWTDLSGNTISSRVEFSLFEMEWNSGDRIRIGPIVESDRPSSFFPVADAVGIQAGDYGWTRWALRLNSSNSRALAANLTTTVGNWYDGDLWQLRTGVDWRPSPFFTGGLNYSEDSGSLSGGNFTVGIERMSLDFSLSPALSLENLIQSDNQSDSLGLQSRLRWIMEDGRELFLVIDSGWQELASGAIVSTGSDVTVKVVYAVRI